MQAGIKNLTNKHVTRGMKLSRSKNKRISESKQGHVAKREGQNRFVGRLAALKVHTDKELEILLDQITGVKSFKDTSE
jgi:hypothetical protein